MQAGTEAKGPTALEFVEDVLQPAVEVAESRLAPLLGVGRDGEQLKPTFSFDNAKIHESGMTFEEALQKFNWSDDMRFPLPTYSPDMHRVIEHAHARAVLQFGKWLYQHPKEYTISKYKKEFERIFRECCKPSTIAADVKGLPELYKVVVQKKGAWAQKELR